MNLLLHICCAPCLIYPLERLKEKGFAVKGFFYNPNIHSFLEYENRKNAAADLGKSVNISIDFPDYDPADFFYNITVNGRGRSLHEKPQRCSMCWRFRLKKTALIAKEKGLDCFSTTLLVSPYQDQELLKEIGEDISKEEGIGFYYEDFRPGFRKAHNEAKEKGIYCQKYCGCIYSEIERYKK